MRGILSAARQGDGKEREFANPKKGPQKARLFGAGFASEDDSCLPSLVGEPPLPSIILLLFGDGNNPDLQDYLAVVRGELFLL